jgi:hypothetical protein
MPAHESWIDLIGSGESELETRFGSPTARRVADGEVWLVFATELGRLRVRCRRASGGTPGAASWSLCFAAPADTLSAAAGRIGLWPAAAPDAAAADVTEPLVRRALTPHEGASGEHSLTATIRGGRFTHISVFDEPPDWV